MPIFNLKLEKTYFQQGFFNVPVDYDRYVRGTEGPIRLGLGRDGAAIDAKIDRRANRNGTARIMGGTALRDWFQKHFAPMDVVAVDLSSKDLIGLYKEELTSAVDDKYRGTTTYFHVFAELVRAAQYRGLTTYQDVAVIMGLPTTGSYMGAETGQILGEISEDEVRAGRPMLSAVAVAVSGKPGPGFYDLARRLGLLTAESEHLQFWTEQRDAVYKAWRRPLPKRQKSQLDSDATL